MNILIILELVRAGLNLLDSQLGGNKTVQAIAALEDIYAKTQFLYQQETGKPIDESKIKPYEPF